MTMEVTNEQLKKCISVEDILVCNDIPSLYHKPGNNDCISKVALRRPLEELHQSCDWYTDSESISRASRIDEITFIIATKEKSSILVDCESREGITHLQLDKGNNKVHAEPNCLIRDGKLVPDFVFRTPASEQKVNFEILNSEATFIDPNAKDLTEVIDEEEKKLTYLVNIQEKWITWNL